MSSLHCPPFSRFSRWCPRFLSESVFPLSFLRSHEIVPPAFLLGKGGHKQCPLCDIKASDLPSSLYFSLCSSNTHWQPPTQFQKEKTSPVATPITNRGSKEKPDLQSSRCCSGSAVLRAQQSQKWPAHIDGKGRNCHLRNGNNKIVWTHWHKRTSAALEQWKIDTKCSEYSLFQNTWSHMAILLAGPS